MADSDFTPVAGAPTDVAPLGRSATKPAHERTADDDIDVADWERVAALAEFKALLAAKARFIVPATAFFVAYYFALPLLVGYLPQWAAKKVFGVVNVAYLFALSQFFMAWLVAVLYIRAAARFDAMTRGVIAEWRKGKR
jgi:uncharacterized membrane protein (DUF485 family)